MTDTSVADAHGYAGLAIGALAMTLMFGVAHAVQAPLWMPFAFGVVFIADTARRSYAAGFLEVAKE